MTIERHVSASGLVENGTVRDSRDAGRVLVVDDEPQAVKLFSAFLSASGIDVVTAGSGEEALEMVSREEFDAIVSDLRMPDMDGFGLLRELRRRDSGVPVVVVSGCPSTSSPSEVLELGAIEFLVKPVAADVLVRAVSTATRLSRLARSARHAEAPLPSDADSPRWPHTAAALDRALTTLYLAWQPIVRASDGQVFGSEAFARTLEPSLAAYDTLFEAARRLNRSRALGRLVRRSTAADLPLLSGEAAFVNVPPVDLGDEELLDPAAPLSLAARSVVLELTDRSPLEDVGNLRDRIRGLRTLGYRMGVDAVRSGGASLQRLALVEPDFAKLSPSYVRGLDRDAARRRTVKETAASLSDLGIRVVATGIETTAERDAAAECGVDLFQGFLLGRPRALRAVAGDPS